MKHIWAAGWLILGAWGMWHAVRLMERGERAVEAAAMVLSETPEQIAAIRAALTAEVEAIRTEAAYQMDQTRTGVLLQTGAAVQIADRRLGQTVALLDARTSYMASSVATIQRDLAPTLKNTAALTKDAQDTMDALYPDIQAATESVTVAATQGAQTAMTVRAAVPGILSGVRTLEDNSNATMAATAEVMKNLATATKPLPWWARVGLAVAPPIAQTGFTVASWAALKGK